MKKTTVKEIKQWMKTLEENRYRKLVNADARRISWFVNNNMSEDYESMPISMKKKWDQAAYGREKYLAKEFIKHLESRQMNENKLEEKLRGLVREVIKRELNEAPKPIHHMDARFLYVPKKDIKNTIKLLRLNIKHGNVEVEKKPSPKVKGHYRLTTTKKMFDDVITHLAMKNVGVKTIAKGKM